VYGTGKMWAQPIKMERLEFAIRIPLPAQFLLKHWLCNVYVHNDRYCRLPGGL
jgi:hypothetical protein